MATYNIQCLGEGLDGVRKCCKLRNLMQKTYLKPNLILLQEHQFNHTNCTKQATQLDFLQGTMLWNTVVYSAQKVA